LAFTMGASTPTQSNNSIPTNELAERPNNWSTRLADTTTYITSMANCTTRLADTTAHTTNMANSDFLASNINAANQYDAIATNSTCWTPNSAYSRSNSNTANWLAE